MVTPIMYENSVAFRRVELEALSAAMATIAGTVESRPQWVADKRRQEKFLTICDEMVRKLPVVAEVAP